MAEKPQAASSCWAVMGCRFCRRASRACCRHAADAERVLLGWRQAEPRLLKSMQSLLQALQPARVELGHVALLCSEKPAPCMALPCWRPATAVPEHAWTQLCPSLLHAVAGGGMSD